MDRKHGRNRGAAARIAGAVAALGLVLAACGGSAGAGDNAAAAESAAESTVATRQVTLEALDNSFSVEELSLPGGETVELTLTNSGANPHTFTSTALGVDTGTVAPGESATVTFTAPDEATEFICSLHGAGGMTGVVVPE